MKIGDVALAESSVQIYGYMFNGVKIVGSGIKSMFSYIPMLIVESSVSESVNPSFGVKRTEPLWSEKRSFSSGSIGGHERPSILHRPS